MGNVISLFQLCDINRVRTEDSSCVNLHYVLAGLQLYSTETTEICEAFPVAAFKSSEGQLLAIILF